MENILQTKAFFDARAPRWDEYCHHDPHKLAAIVTLAQAGEGTRILDIGCGTGVLFPELLSRGVREVVGADVSGGMLAIAAQKCRDPRVRLYEGDFLEFPETGFDVAVLYSVYPHFLDKPVLIKRVWEALVPGGRFLVAHSEGRDTINGCHRRIGAEEVSGELRPVREAAALWESLFTVDSWADRPELYFFSGVKATERPSSEAGKCSPGSPDGRQAHC